MNKKEKEKAKDLLGHAQAILNQLQIVDGFQSSKGLTDVEKDIQSHALAMKKILDQVVTTST
jgi:hypothetical protein